jgi:hypothetical protein
VDDTVCFFGDELQTLRASDEHSVEGFYQVWMMLFMKCVPWSLIKILGHPNLVITCSNIKCAAVYVLQSFIGVASAHLVRYFISVIIYLALVLLAGGLMGPTKPITHFLNA